MPVGRGDIDAQLRDIGESERWWEQREFRDLPYILHADERLQGVVTGKLVRRVLRSARWLIVATTERLICLREERFGRQQVEIQFSQVTGMQQTTKLRGVQITLETVNGKYRIRVARGDAFRFIGAISPLLPRPAGLPQGESGAGLVGVPRLAGLVSRVATLPAPDHVARAGVGRLETAVENLENQVERLQERVEFLENLLQKRSDENLALPARSAES
jgi:hypothetical protein